jgi:hypothetical protein
MILPREKSGKGIMPSTSIGGSAERASPYWDAVFVTPMALALTPVDYCLAGMVGAGHGLDALVYFLGLTREALLDRIVALGLKTPHDRPMRRLAGKRPWIASDVQQLLHLWVMGIRAVSIAEQLGRTPGSVRAKARRLGLPKRNRSHLVRLAPAAAPKLVDVQPVEPEAAILPQTDETAPAAAVMFVPALPDTPDLDVETHPERQPTPALPGEPTPEPVTLPASIEFAESPQRCISGPAVSDPGAAPSLDNSVERRKERQTRPGEKVWRHELDMELSMRVWAMQHPKAIARDLSRLGVTPSGVSSRITRLEIPPRKRSQLVDNFDPDRAEAAIADAQYVARICPIKKRLFWSPRRNGARGWCQEARDSKEWDILMGGLF